MTPNSTLAKELSSPRFSLRIGQALRRYFVTGLATIFPVTVTVILVLEIFRFTDGKLRELLGIQIPGLGLLATGLIVLIVGVFSVHFFGRVLFRTLEGWLGRLPLVRKVYPLVKQFADFLFQEDQTQARFHGVVLVEFPRQGCYSIAFVTKRSETSVLGTPRTMLTLMVPTPPSPLTGPIIFVPEKDVVPLELTVEDAFKLVLSGGVVAPPLEGAKSLSKPMVGAS